MAGNHILGVDQVHMMGNHHPLYGNGPVMFWGTLAVDGDATPWVHVGVGSMYFWQSSTGENSIVYSKVKNDGANNDWTCTEGLLRETVTYADFTDGGAAVGTYTSSESLPIGAVVTLSWVVVNSVFSGDTSCALDIGDGTDEDRYTSGAALDIFTSATFLSGGAPQGTAYHAAAKSPVLTATSGSDWGSVATTGSLTYTIQYYIA